MDTTIITLPTVWDANNSTKQNGNDIIVEAIKGKDELDQCLKSGFTVKATTSFVFNNVAYINYVLEREGPTDCDKAKLQKAKDLLQTLMDNAPNDYVGDVERGQAKLAKWLQTVADAERFCKEN